MLILKVLNEIFTNKNQQDKKIIISQENHHLSRMHGWFNTKKSIYVTAIQGGFQVPRQWDFLDHLLKITPPSVPIRAAV